MVSGGNPPGRAQKPPLDHITRYTQILLSISPKFNSYALSGNKGLIAYLIAVSKHAQI